MKHPTIINTGSYSWVHRGEVNLLDSSKNQGLREKSLWCPAGQHNPETRRQLKPSIIITEVTLLEQESGHRSAD